MSWFDRFTRRAPDPAPSSPPPPASGRTVIRGDGSFGLACVGESNYVPALLQAAGAGRSAPGPIEEFVEVRLVCEPDNPYDGNAVAVMSASHRKLAYLSREDAADVTEEVARATREHELWCNARIGGRRVDGSGWRIGIWLDVPV